MPPGSARAGPEHCPRSKPRGARTQREAVSMSRVKYRHKCGTAQPSRPAQTEALATTTWTLCYCLVDPGLGNAVGRAEHRRVAVFLLVIALDHHVTIPTNQIEMIRPAGFKAAFGASGTSPSGLSSPHSCPDTASHLVPGRALPALARTMKWMVHAPVVRDTMTTPQPSSSALSVHS